MPGGFELVIILVIVVILFGVGKLPKVLGQLGKGVKAFKEGVQGNEISGLDEEEEEAVDVTPEEAPIAIDEKPQEPVEEAEEVVASAPAEPAEDQDEDEDEQPA